MQYRLFACYAWLLQHCSINYIKMHLSLFYWKDLVPEQLE